MKRALHNMHCIQHHQKLCSKRLCLLLENNAYMEISRGLTGMRGADPGTQEAILYRIFFLPEINSGQCSMYCKTCKSYAFF